VSFCGCWRGERVERQILRDDSILLAAVGFWDFLGARVFGSIINLPIVFHYEIGAAPTENHAHAAMVGVYGMLSIG